ncbi:MAG: Ig-like domain-containing protein [Hyphomonadaceae bacterium]|nr:Ig-like domain-containing protein [Hyphomonadaceae bacterium]
MFGSRISAVLIALAHLCLAACGGGGGGGGGSGGGGGGGTANRPPVVVLAGAISVVTGAEATPDASGSSDPDGTAITFAWMLTSKPAGSAVALTGAATARPTFRADKDGTYILSVTVSDGALSTMASTTVTAASNAGDLAAAAAAQLTATVDLGASLILRWRDSFPAGGGYRIETQATDGSWTAVDVIAGVGGGNAPIVWSRAYGGAATWRVVALTAGREIPILSLSGLSALNVDVPAGVQIAIDKADPISGVAQLSVTAAPIGSTVAWTVDGIVIGSGNPLSWNTATVPDSSHALLARLNLGGDVAVDIRRNVTTSNPTLALSATDSIVATNTIRIDVAASSSAGISRVDISVDGGATQTLTAPNGCGAAASCPLGFNRYQFSYNTLTLGSGNHTASITATDTATTTRTISYPFSIANGPSLTLSTPSKGFLIGPTLQLTGSTTTDTGQPVTVTASLGTRPIYTGTAANFSSGIVLANVPGFPPGLGNPPGFTPGDYTLTVVATDVNNKTATIQRPVVVTSGTLQAAELLFVTDDAGTIWGVNGDLVLYRTADQRDHIRNSQTGVVVDLALTGTTTPVDMTLSTNWVFGVAQGAGSICKTTDYCVYRWSTSTGAISVLSDLDPNPPSPTTSVYRQELKLRGNFLIWRTLDRNTINPPSKISIYDISTGAFSLYTPGTRGGGSASIGVAGGLPVVASTGLAPSGGLPGCPNNACVTVWTAAGGERVLANVGSSESVNVRTDGTNVAFSLFLAPTHTGSLSIVPVSGGASTLLSSSTASIIEFDNASLAWSESGGTYALSQAQPKVRIGSSSCPSSPQRLANGLLAFCNFGGSYTWNAVTGVSTLRVETVASPMFITGNWMYFKSGVNVYRVAVS